MSSEERVLRYIVGGVSLGCLFMLLWLWVFGYLSEAPYLSVQVAMVVFSFATAVAFTKSKKRE